MTRRAEKDQESNRLKFGEFLVIKQIILKKIKHYILLLYLNTLIKE